MNLKSCTRRGGCLWYAIQAVRWFPTFLVGAILSWGYYAYVYQMCYLTISNIFQQLIYLIVFHLLLIMLVWSYYQTCMTDPASPPEAFFYNPDDEQDSAIQLMENHVQMLLERYVNLKHLPVFSTGFGGEIRYCEKCKCIKPDRSHHCSVCGTCVLRFDHHCPWVNNCVNHANYKFFVLFLGYGFTFCLWIFFTDLQFFIAFWQRELHGGPLDANLHLLFLTFVSGMFAVSLSVLFFYHLWLTSKNRSTVESFRSPIINGVSDKNAYNHGIKANYIEVFGSDPWYWFLPIFTTLGDGVSSTKWTIEMAKEYERSRKRSITSQIGALRYSLLSQRDDDAEDKSLLTGNIDEEINPDDDDAFVAPSKARIV